MSDENMIIERNGRIGIQNTNPQSMLHLGNCEVPGSAPVIVFCKNGAENGHTNALVGFNPALYSIIADYGNKNAGSNALG